jgi:antitoxin HicB
VRKDRPAKASRKRRLSPDEYLRLNYKRVLVPDPDGDGFSAKLLEFPGCFAEGETPEEAYGNLELAAADWIEAALAQGQTIPEPAGGDEYSGKIVLRLPRALHQQATELAGLNQTSLNQFLVGAIASRVGAEDIVERLLDRVREGIMVASQPLAFAQVNLAPVLVFSPSDIEAAVAKAISNATPSIALPNPVSLKSGV